MRLERKVVMKGPAPAGHDTDLVFFLESDGEPLEGLS